MRSVNAVSRSCLPWMAVTCTECGAADKVWAMLDVSIYQEQWFHIGNVQYLKQDPTNLQKKHLAITRERENHWKTTKTTQHVHANVNKHRNYKQNKQLRTNATNLKNNMKPPSHYTRRTRTKLCSYDVLMMCWWCFGDVWMMFWWCTGDVLVVFS